MIKESTNEIKTAFMQELHKVNESITNLTLRVQSMEKRIEATAKKQQSLEKDVEEVKRVLERVPEDILGEFERRTARRKNVIVRGFPETNEGSVEDRRKADKENLTELLEQMELPEIDIENVARLGKPRSGSSRLLKFRTSTKDEKRRILKNASSLRNEEKYKSVYLSSDLTPFQQATEKALRNELKDRREKGEDVVIHRGKVQTRTQLQNFQARF